jgi:sucrose-6-phosphate hydrolase SacC (GH32 family)
MPPPLDREEASSGATCKLGPVRILERGATSTRYGRYEYLYRYRTMVLLYCTTSYVASGKFVAGSTANLVVDTFNTVLYSMLGVAEGRMITMGWVLTGPMKSTKTGQYRSSDPDDALAVPRALRFDATNLQLLAMPVPELVQLRAQQPLGSHTQTVLQTGMSLPLFDQGGATAFDLELVLELAMEAIAVDIVLLASSPAQVVSGGLAVGINASALATAGDRRTISLIVAEQKVLAFTLPPGARSLNVRALADRNVVEVFVGDGRGIYTSAVNISDVAVPGAFLTARLPVTLTNSSAWKMGCCWKADRAL